MIFGEYLYEVGHYVVDEVAVGESGANARQVPSKLGRLHRKISSSLLKQTGKTLGMRETSRRAAEMPLMRGLWLLRPRTSSLKVAIKVKLRLKGVNKSIIIFVDQSSRSFILGMFSVLSLKSRLPELGQDTRRSTTMSSLGI